MKYEIEFVADGILWKITIIADDITAAIDAFTREHENYTYFKIGQGVPVSVEANE